MGKNKNIGLPGGPNEIIVDPKGQWNHPGKNTRIEGNQITMQDVEYPVWAQPNVGPGTMMMPGSEHYFKNADYVDEYPMAQDGTEIPDEAAVPADKSFLYDLEKLVNKSLGDINNKAKDFSENPEEMNNIDNMRHASGGRYAAEAIQQKVRDIPYVGGLLDFVGVDKAAGFIGANAMGVGHELRTIFGGDERPFLAKLQEMGEDTFNNYVGSIVGSLNIDSSKKDEVIKYLSYNNLLPDGYVRTEKGKTEGLSENIYFKDPDGNVKRPKYQLGGVINPQSTLMSLYNPADTARFLTPLPQNASQLIWNKLSGSNAYNFKDSTYHANEHLKRSVLNAIARTGKIKGGTEYIDYSPAVARDINSLNMSDLNMLAGSVLSPELAAATTFGRVSYEQDPKTGDITIYDSYDFNSTPQKNSTYSKIRSLVGNNKEGQPNVVGVFNPKDDVNLGKKIINDFLNPIDAMNIKYDDIKALTNIPSYLYKELKNILPTGQDLKKLQKYLPTFQDAGSTSTPEKQIEFMTNWANSPMHNQMLNASSNSDKFKDKVRRDRSNFDNVNIVDDEVDGFLGQYINGQVTMNPSALNEHLIGNGYDSVLVHELSHFTDDSNPDNKGHFKGSNIPLSDSRLIKKYGKEGIKRAKLEEKELNELLETEGLKPNDKEVIEERVKRLKYLADPTETRSRINATRYFYEEDDNFGRSSERNIDKNLPSIFDSPVTPEMIEVMKKSGQYKQLQEIYTDDQILEMFNTISDSKTPERSFDVLNARYGKELPTAQKGKSILKALLNSAKKWAPDLFGKTDDVVKAVGNTSKKGLYEMLPIKQLEYPTHYGSVNIDDGTVQNALDILKAQGKYADEVGFEVKDLVGNNIQYLGNQGGRTIVNVPLPNGKSQMFYKSTNLAGKGTEGLWQPYAGHARVLDFPSKNGPFVNENWFIKDSGFKDYYDSQSFRDIAGNLDRIAAEQGWDMSEQILKSKLKYGGDLPKAQRGLIKSGIKSLAKYSDEIIPTIRNYFRGVDEFTSEIDWAKWNKEIPDNAPLMQEYNTIEKVGKAKGTWMKNPDGSKFTGTPEQWVQQQSSNYKAAFGETKLLNPDGSPMIVYHGSPKKFDAFDESMFQLGDSGYSGSGIYTTPSKTTAESYTISGKRFHDGEIEPTLYELYGRGNNPITSKQLIDNSGGDIGFGKVGELIDKNLPSSLFNFHRKGAPRVDQLLKYDVAIKNQNRGITNIRPIQDAWEIVFPTNKQLKSSIGNNGMFDMTDPNIYKQKGGATGYDPYFDIDDESKQRREKLNAALNTVVANSDNDSNLEALLLMTAAMENSYGGNSDAYGRNYTRGPMSIDDAAYNDLFDPRGENNRFTAQQKKMFDWLSSMGLDHTNMDNALKAGDELAGMAAARMQYARSPESLPSSLDPDAMYNYYMKFYNKTNADHKKRFLENYDAFIKPQLKTGGENDPYSRYKKYVDGGFVGSDEDKNNYDKINRINYADAKAVGMSPANYIMTEFSKRS